MANVVYGHVTCPFCSNDRATVHKEARGRRAWYYRCYSDDPAHNCGTVQIRYESGQTWIKANMRPLTMQEQDATAEAVAAEVKQEQVEAARTVRKRGRFSSLFLSDDDDD